MDMGFIMDFFGSLAESLARKPWYAARREPSWLEAPDFLPTARIPFFCIASARRPRRYLPRPIRQRMRTAVRILMYSFTRPLTLESSLTAGMMPPPKAGLSLEAPAPTPSAALVRMTAEKATVWRKSPTEDRALPRPRWMKVTMEFLAEPA